VHVSRRRVIERRMWWTFLIAAGVAQAQDEAAELAPSVADLRAANSRLAKELAVADLLADVVGTTQNAWVESGASSACDSGAGGVAARSAVFGTAWRDVVQRARSLARNTSSMAENPLLTPVMTGSDNIERVVLAQRVAVHERSFAESRMWHGRHMAPLQRRCGGSLVAFNALGGRAVPAVFAWSGPGVLCLDGQPQPLAQPVVISDQRACIASDAQCSCIAHGVLSGSVLTATVTE
jgi:hypothetical protein